jgi:hypothetical protein
MLQKLLFETPFGEWLLTQLEKRVGLALVSVNWLDDQTASPVAGWQPSSRIEDARTDLASGQSLIQSSTDKATTRGGTPC